MWHSLRKKKKPHPPTPVRLQSGLESVLGTDPSDGIRVADQALAKFLPAAWKTVYRADPLSYGIGRAATGDRVTVLAACGLLNRSTHELRRAVLHRIPFVVHALLSETDEPSALQTSGAVVLMPRNGETAAQCAVAARRIAESEMIPVICVLETDGVARSRQPAQSTGAPTPVDSSAARTLLFGERSDVPAWMDTDHPLGLGMRDDGQKGIAARAAFFQSNSPMGEACVDTYRTDDATHFLVAFGVLAERLVPVVDAVRSDRLGTLGLVQVTQLSPWPHEMISSVVAGRPFCLFAPDARAISVPASIRASTGNGLPDFAALVDTAARLLRYDLPPHHIPGVFRPSERPLPPETERTTQMVRTLWPKAADAWPTPIRSDTGPEAILIASGAPLAEWINGPLADALASTGVHVRTMARGSALVAVSHDGSLPAGPASHLIISEPNDLSPGDLDELLAPEGRIVWADGVAPEPLIRKAAGRRAQSVSCEDGMRNWALLGAAVHVLAPDATVRDEVVGALIRRFHAEGVLSEADVGAVLDVLKTAHDPVAATLVPSASGPRPESAPPRSVGRAAGRAADTVSDSGRWWRNEGYLHDMGRDAEREPTPFDGVAVLPAATAAVRPGIAPAALLPSLVPEMCSGCAQCWTVCPDSAIIPWTGSFDSLIEKAFGRLSAAGGTAPRLERMRAPWASASHRLFRSDDLAQYRTLRGVLEESLQRLLTRAAPSEEQRAEILDDFERVAAYVPSMGLARTAPFFDEPEQRKSGSGGPLALAIDPDACTRCGACIAICPDNALASSGQTEDARAETKFCLEGTEPVFDREAVAGAVFGGRRALESVSGFRAPAGVRSAVRAVAVAAEATVSEGMRGFHERVLAARAALETAAQESLHASVTVRDFEDLNRRLASIEHEGAAPLLPDLIPGDGVAPEALRQQVPARMRMQKLANRLEAGPARLVAVISDDGTVPVPQRPDNPFAFPWTVASPLSAGDTAAGLFDGLANRHCRDVASVREAELIANGVYDESEHAAALRDLSWADLTPEERAASPAFVVWCGSMNDGLRRLLTGRLPVRIALIDADGLAESGVPEGRRCSVGHPDQLAKTLLSGFADNQATLFHVLAPVVTDFVQSAIAMVEIGTFPLARTIPDAIPDATPSAPAPADAPVEPAPQTAPELSPEQLTDRLLEISGFGPGHSRTLRQLLDEGAE